MRPRLVACDLDGTLVVRDNRLSDRSAEAVWAARDAGVLVLAVTGRPWQWTLGLARRHDLLPTAVCSNGACLLDVATGELEVTGLAEAAALTLVDRVRAAVPGVVFALDGVDRLGYEPGFVDEDFLGDHVIDDLPAWLVGGAVKLIAKVPGADGSELAAALDDAALDGLAVASHFGGEWVELLAAGVSKASGLAAICDQLGVDRHEVMAVGDGRNDVPMLEWAGSAVAVDGSPDELLAVADRVVPAGECEGVAGLLEELAATPAG
ncbi:MAG: HAD family hydrolase [Acidimicrobiales bacterium]